MNNLGYCYYKGEGTTKDFKQAFFWFKKAAEANNPYGMDSLADCYYNGEGTEKDLVQAFYWYKKAAEADNSIISSVNKLGYMYANAEGTAKDNEKAILWYKKSLETKEDTKIMSELGKAYKNNKNYSDALFIFIKASEKGNANAMFEMAQIYYQGLGVSKDNTQGDYWRKKAKEKALEDGNDIQLLEHIAFSYHWEINQDEKEAFQCYQKAAEIGSTKAMKELVTFYETGKGGVSKDYKEAFAWCKKAAEAGDDEAMYHLAELYLKGKGTKKDKDQAKYWLQKSCDYNINKGSFRGFNPCEELKKLN
jgi:TPR repeat protein, SEL1 subfamily